MSPPYLAGDTPVPHVFQPVEVDLDPSLWIEGYLTLFGGLYGGLGQGLHPDEPLVGEVGLYDRMAAVAVAHGVDVWLYLHQESLLSQFFHQGLPALEPVHAGKFPCLGIHGAVFGHNGNGLELVAEGHLKIVGVMGRGHFHCPCAKFLVHHLVSNDGYLPPHDGQEEMLAYKLLVAFIPWVYGHCHVPQHGLRAGGGYGNAQVGLVTERVPEVPQGTLVGLVVYLVISQCRLTPWAPVDDVLAFVYEALLPEPHEGLPYGPG